MIPIAYRVICAANDCTHFRRKGTRSTLDLNGGLSLAEMLARREGWLPCHEARPRLSESGEWYCPECVARLTA